MHVLVSLGGLVGETIVPSGVVTSGRQNEFQTVLHCIPWEVLLYCLPQYFQYILKLKLATSCRIWAVVEMVPRFVLS